MQRDELVVLVLEREVRSGLTDLDHASSATYLRS